MRKIMSPKVWATSEDDQIDFISFTPEYTEGTIEVMRTIYNGSYTCKAVGLPEHEGAISELDEFNLRIIQQGLSVIAVERETNIVCGVAFNKIRSKHDSEGSGFVENFRNSCKHSASKNFLDVMLYQLAQCNLFEHCQVDCLLDMVFLGVLPEFRNRGIATALSKVTVELVARLLAGENVKQSIDGKELALEPVPKIVAAIFSSPFTRKMGRSLNWEIATTFSMNDLLVDGKRLTAGLAGYTIEFKKLN